jgi:hypothetical protein
MDMLRLVGSRTWRLTGQSGGGLCVESRPPTPPTPPSPLPSDCLMSYSPDAARFLRSAARLEQTLKIIFDRRELTRLFSVSQRGDTQPRCLRPETEARWMPPPGLRQLKSSNIKEKRRSNTLLRVAPPWLGSGPDTARLPETGDFGMQESQQGSQCVGRSRRPPAEFTGGLDRGENGHGLIGGRS